MYKIIADSTSDLTPELVKELDVEIIPYYFTIDDKTYGDYPDQRDISTKDFYDTLRAGKLSTTVQVTPERFMEIFTPYLEAGKDILYVGFSSGLSGTYQSSLIAKRDLEEKFPDRKIISIDTKAASMGQGLLVYHVCKLKESGATIEEAAKWLEENHLHMAHWFTVDDLYHLKRGGRISGAVALVGTALGIKPVMHMDNEGHLIDVSKARGKKQSMDSLVQQMIETAVDPKDQMVFISHGDAPEDAEYLKKQIAEKMGVKNFKINYIGPVIGAHSGPGTVSIFFLGTHR